MCSKSLSQDFDKAQQQRMLFFSTLDSSTAGNIDAINAMKLASMTDGVELRVLRRFLCLNNQLLEFRNREILRPADAVGESLINASGKWEIELLLWGVEEHKQRLSIDFLPHAKRWLDLGLNGLAHHENDIEFMETCCFTLRHEPAFDGLLSNAILQLLMSERRQLGLELCRYLHDRGMRFWYLLLQFLKDCQGSELGWTLTVIEEVFLYTSYDISVFADPLAEIFSNTSDIRVRDTLAGLAIFFDLSRHENLRRALETWNQENMPKSNLYLG